MISPLRTYQTVPLTIAQPRHPQTHRLHRAGGLADVDDVPDAVLVLEDHEDTGQEVRHQALRSEADGDTEDAALAMSARCRSRARTPP
jgi:hypothetical protein